MFENVFAILAGLAGLGGLISMLVNVGKALGWIKDGQGGTWFEVLNFIAFVVVGVLYFVEVEVDWSTVDSFLEITASVIGLVLQIGFGKLTYKTVKGGPLIGFSYSE